jgi:hypothetical protein
MKRSSLSFVAGAIVAAATTTAILNHPAARADAPPMPDGFTVTQIRFDESDGIKKPTPGIPGSWRFVGISSGESATTNLWFQEPSGTICVVPAYGSGAHFVLQGYIDELPVAGH